MNRWSTKYLAALPFLFGCDDVPSPEVELADAGGTRAGAPNDVLVVHFEVRSSTPSTPMAPPIGERGPLAPPADFARTPPDAARVSAEATTEAAAERAHDLPADTRWLVMDGRLVLAQGDAIEASWGSGGPGLIRTQTDGDGLFVAARGVDHDALPLALTRLAGREIKVYDREREVCVARVGAQETLSLRAALVHLPDAWAEEPFEPPTHEAAEVFEQGLVTLSMALEPLMGDCGAGLWAAPLEAPRPVLYREAALSPKLRRQAIAAFRGLPAWRSAQHEMLAFYADGPERRALRKERWDTLYGTRPEVTRLVADRGGRQLLVVVGDSIDGCGSPGQRLVSLLEVVDGGKAARLVELTSLPFASTPAGLVDLEGDGVIELIGGGAGGLAIERWHGERAAPSEDNDWIDERVEPVHGYQIPDLTHYGCPC